MEQTLLFEPIEPKNNKVQVFGNEQTISSLEIAEITGKRHSDILEAIRNMETAWEKVCKRKFSLTFTINKMPNGGERKDPIYALTKTECLYIATKFNDEARARLVLRWEQLELKSIASLPDFNNPAAAARAWAEQYDKAVALSAQNIALIEEGKKKDVVIEQKDAEIEQFKADNADLVEQLGLKDEDIAALRKELEKTKNIEAVNYLFNNDSTNLYTWREASDKFFPFKSFYALQEYVKFKKIASDANGEWKPLAPFKGEEVGYMEYYRPYHMEKGEKVYTEYMKFTRKGVLAIRFKYDKDIRAGRVVLKDKHLYDKDGKRIAILYKEKHKNAPYDDELSPYGTQWE